MLDGQRSRLAASGILYPERWQGFWGNGDLSHQGLIAAMKDSHGARTAGEDLKRLAERHRSDDVVISCENFALLLQLLTSLEQPAEFLAAAREEMPVTCIWTLRRFDEFRRSLYLQFVGIGYVPGNPFEFMGEGNALQLFERMRMLEDHVDRVVYLKYDTGGGHHKKLIHEIDLPQPTAEVIERELATAPRLNQSLTRKQAIALLHLKGVSSRAGVPLDEERLRELLLGRELDFDGDSSPELIPGAVARGLHEEALEAAADCGLDSYTRFFGEEEVEARPEAAGMSPNDLSDEDLDRLVAACGETIR